MRSSITVFINGRRHELKADKARMMLAEYLRYEKALTGTKIVCAEGDCGACSVLRLFPNKENPDYLPFNSCITPMAILDGSSLVTVDAIKNEDKLHQCQKTMVECHGSQCGFCTPGFVVSLAALVEKKIEAKEKNIQKQEAKNALTGNLCRCTGYESILTAATQIDVKKEASLKERYYTKEQEKELKEIISSSVLLADKQFSFFAPKTLSEASSYLEKNPQTKIIASATDLGVVQNKRKAQFTKLMSLHLIDDLYSINQVKNQITIGARVTLTELRYYLKKKVPHFAQYLDIFASPQIKNVATLIGNIANASPIGDTAPVLLALEAQVNLVSSAKNRTMPLSEFFLDYRKTAIAPGELISSIDFKVPEKNSDFYCSKNSSRKDLDISTVNLAIKIDWRDKGKKEIQDIVIAAGGIAAIPLRLKQTEVLLKSNTLTEELYLRAANELHKEFNPLSDLRASASYRRVVLENYFKRFFESIFTEVKA